MNAAALLQDVDFDVSRLIKQLAQFAALFFFIGLPILKSLLESRRKARERDATGGAGSARRDAQAEARRRWEELLRGEGESSVPASPPPLPRAPVAAPATPAEPPSRPLVVFGEGGTSTPREESLETARDEEASAQEEIARRLREELRRREQLTRAEREATSSRRTTAEPSPSPAFELDPIVATEVETTSEPRAGSRRVAMRLASRAELRRAVVASEVLGPPLALRGRNGARSYFDLPS